MADIIHPPYPPDHPWHGFQLLQDYAKGDGGVHVHQKNEKGDFVDAKSEGDGYLSTVIRISDNATFGPYKFTGEALGKIKELLKVPAETPAEEE